MTASRLAVILATVALSAVAQIALKAGVTSARAAQAPESVQFLLAAAQSPLVWLGLTIYGISVIAWLWVLARVDVSVAYPFVGMSFVLTSAMGWLLFHENVGPLRIAGILLVVAGCVLIARSAAS
jgi:multidrug transporter EmrE-like cation transporter